MFVTDGAVESGHSGAEEAPARLGAFLA